MLRFALFASLALVPTLSFASDDAPQKKKGRTFKPVPAFFSGAAAGFAGGFLGGLVHPLVGGVVTPFAVATAGHPFTDAGYGWEVVGAHVGWLGGSPVGIPARVLVEDDGGATSPLNLGLTGLFALTSAGGMVIAAHVDSKNKRKKGLQDLRISPIAEPETVGAVIHGRW